MHYTAPITRKTFNIKTFYNDVKKYKIQSSKIIVEKEIRLSSDEFIDFSNNLLKDRDYIKNNLEHMWFDQNTQKWHCLEVTSDDSKETILVESEGYSYARYVSVIKKK